MPVNTLKATVMKTEMCSFQHRPVRGPESRSTNWNTGSSLRTSETALGYVEVLKKVEALEKEVMGSPF